jgi:hypothetical protein
MPIAAARQGLVRVSGITGYFATNSEVETTADASREFDGGSMVPEVLTGPATTGDVTVGRPYKPERDAAIVRKLRPLVGRWRTSLSITPTDRDLAPVEKPETLTAVLIGVRGPATDANSSDPKRIELTFAIETVA